MTNNQNLETATFGAGCFWGVEAAYRKIKGVKETAVGYMGGDLDNPTYEDVSGDKTGHVETVSVVFDPKEISYNELLVIFWENHDPTQVNKQGPDVGTQYRSVIFYQDDEQRKLAEHSKQALENSGKYLDPIATSIEPAGKFNVAEEYHQQYLQKRGQATCHVDLKV